MLHFKQLFPAHYLFLLPLVLYFCLGCSSNLSNSRMAQADNHDARIASSPDGTLEILIAESDIAVIGKINRVVDTFEFYGYDMPEEEAKLYESNNVPKTAVIDFEMSIERKLYGHPVDSNSDSIIFRVVAFSHDLKSIEEFNQIEGLIEKYNSPSSTLFILKQNKFAGSEHTYALDSPASALFLHEDGVTYTQRGSDHYALGKPTKPEQFISEVISIARQSGK